MKVKASQILGTDIIAIENGSRIDDVKDHVKSIGQDAVLIDSKDALQDTSGQEFTTGTESTLRRGGL
jgi:uncharacterized protein YrrD